MGVTVSSTGSGSYMKINSKDVVATKSPDFLDHMQRVSGVDHEQIVILMQLMNQHPNKLVDATLKNFVATLKLAHSEPLAELVSEARRLRIQQEQHEKMKREAAVRRMESLEQDLASELDANVMALRGLMHSMMGHLRQGISRERMDDPCNKKLIAFLCTRFDLELQSALRGWFRTHKILKVTDERFVELARQIDNIPHGILRDMISSDGDLQTTNYRNKFRYLMKHVRYAGFTGSHDWGV